MFQALTSQTRRQDHSEELAIAAFAKIGAVATAFLFPILLVTIGTRWLLYSLVIASLLGAVVTSLFRIETTGVNLDQIGEEASKPEGSSAVLQRAASA